MAVERQQQFLGQMRVDAPHLRAIESGVAHDFDVLAGAVLAGQEACVVEGFRIVEAGAVGGAAEALVLQVAGSSLINYEATEPGSVFRVPADRADEVLGPTNPRVIGAFTPNATNFVGVDLRRLADDTTADTVQFLDPDTNEERPEQVPLARTLDYRVVISTTEFSAAPHVCPVAKVVTNAANQVVSVTDARNFMFRLGTGGSNPQAVAPYGWPGGRNEGNPALASVAGDRSIGSLREWGRAAMTRIWEVGGGEYWYSPTADRNVRLASISTMANTGEPFEWTGTHLLWAGLRVLFDNSTANINEVQDQISAAAGLTDLADGDCVYVDLDRTTDRKVSTANPLVAQKGVLKTLGMSSRPGQRIVLAWRSGANVFVRDQVYPVGSGLKVATTAANGTVRLSATPLNPLAPLVATVTSAARIVGVGGISRKATGTTGDLTIGLGVSEGDQNVVVSTTGAQYATSVNGEANWPTQSRAVLEATNSNDIATTPGNRVARLRAWNNGATRFETALAVDVTGAIGMRPTPTGVTVAAPAPTNEDPVRAKMVLRTNGLASPNTRDQWGILWHDGSFTVVAEGPAY